MRYFEKISKAEEDMTTEERAAQKYAIAKRYEEDGHPRKAKEYKKKSADTYEKAGKEKQAFLNKEALVSGVHPKDYIMYNGRFDIKDLQPLYAQYVKQKSSEPKTKWQTAVGVGGGIGGLTGGVIAALITRGTSSASSAIPIVAGIGLGLGSLFGLLAKAVDDNQIEEAKRIVSSSNASMETKIALMRELEDYAKAQSRHKEVKEDLKHLDLVDAISSRKP